MTKAIGSLIPNAVLPQSSEPERAIGQAHVDAHVPTADLAHLHALMGHYARMLWDIQKTRIGLTNRISAMERDALPEEFFGPAADTGGSLTTAERQINRYLERLASQHPMADWIAEAPGIGPAGFARLLAVTGPLDRFANPSKLWKYLGLHTTNGIAPKRRRGETWTHTNCQAIWRSVSPHARLTITQTVRLTA